MVHPIASKSPRGRWAWCLAGLLLAAPARARQVEEPGPADEAPPASEARQVEQARREADQQDALRETIFVDPVARPLMENRFDQLYTAALTAPSRNEIRAMAEGRSRVDSSAIDRYVKHAARELTQRNNIDAVLRGVDGDPDDASKIQEAGLDLLEPYSVSLDQRDDGFFNAYSARFYPVAAELLRNHLLARTQAMVALSRTADPRVLKPINQILADPQQPSSLKLLAATGVLRTAEARTVDVRDRVETARALATFLREEPESLWLAQARALEAMGMLRRISGIQNRDEAEFAAVILEILFDESRRLEVRAAAALALGMLEVPATYPQVNYGLISHQVGRLAAAIGSEIARLDREARDEAEELGEPLLVEPPRVAYLTGLLVRHVYPALYGQRGVRNSGLSNSTGLGPYRDQVREVEDLVLDLTLASVTLSQARSNQLPPASRTFDEALEALEAHLLANPPESTTIIPGGRDFAANVTPATDASE